MKTRLKTFRVNTNTSFGIGIFDKKAIDIEDCFKRLSKSEKQRATSIEDLCTEDTRQIENGILLNHSPNQ